MPEQEAVDDVAIDLTNRPLDEYQLLRIYDVLRDAAPGDLDTQMASFEEWAYQRIGRAEDALARRDTQVATLIAALHRYGVHEYPTCNRARLSDGETIVGPCTCGLRDLLDATDEGADLILAALRAADAAVRAYDEDYLAPEHDLAAALLALREHGILPGAGQ